MSNNINNEDLSDIISGIKSSYQRSNIQDLNLENMLEIRPEVKIGYLLQNMESESTKNYIFNFDPVQTLFLNKLVNENVLDKRIIIKAEDFFKGIVFIDYFTSIICNETGLIDDLYDFAKKLEHQNQELDPELDFITKYASTYYLHHNTKFSFSEVRSKSLERYQRKNKKYEPEFIVTRKVSAIYEGLGSMVYDLANNNVIKQELPNMLYLYDIKAALFVDAILDNIQSDEFKEKILEKFSKKDYYNASILAISSLANEVSNSSFNQYLSSINTGGNNE